MKDEHHFRTLKKETAALTANSAWCRNFQDESGAIWLGSAFISKTNEGNSVRHTLVAYFMARISKEGIT